MQYVAFLRGVNVGGKAMIKMADLARELSDAGLQDVRTYIQSGNVLFTSDSTNKKQLAEQIQKVIGDKFKLDVAVAIFSKDEWQKVIAGAPKWWGTDDSMKHNMLIMIEPFNMGDVVKAYGEPKPDIEALQPGNGVLYQSLSWDSFGKTVGGKVSSNPIYKQMTTRNYNTSQKILSLLEAVN